MKSENIFFCKNCGKILSTDFAFCPFCGYRRKGIGSRFLPGFTILYIMLMIMSIAFFIIGFKTYKSEEALAGVLFSLATALGPVSILGLIYEHLLKDSLKEAALTSFSQLSQNVCQRSIDNLSIQFSKVEDLTKRLMHIARVGLIAAFSERRWLYPDLSTACFLINSVVSGIEGILYCPKTCGNLFRNIHVSHHEENDIGEGFQGPKSACPVLGDFDDSVQSLGYGIG